jgi:TolA-binding protein
LPHSYKAMNCKEVEELEILEGYLLDRLTEPERDEFERHYFECASCFSQLQNRRMLQVELRLLPFVHARAGGARRRRMWAWVPAFATLPLLLVVGIWWYSVRKPQYSQKVSSSSNQVRPEVLAQSQPPPPAPSLEELARVEPPPYTAVVLRGAQDEAQEAFRETMKYYSRGDYAQAIPGLRTAVKASPRTARFNFYLGACYLLTDQTDLAIESFRRTISLGEPIYSEPAHFYLAKAYLRKKNVSGAADELQTTIQIHGGKEAEAEGILRRLRR